MKTQAQKVMGVGFCLLLFLTGCSHIKEFTKTLWGSSTRALEEARVNAVRQTFRCQLEDCFDEVIKIVQDNEMIIFQKSLLREFIVVMHVPDSIDTTEVGIFFDQLPDGKTRIEMSSLSTSAKENAAGVIFPALEKKFPMITHVDLSKEGTGRNAQN